ncbi:MAG: YchJ family metal-binding protein [Rhodocyclaceae bacterium]
MPDLTCPCGSNRPYARCCGPLHEGTPAASAEALMRSRYTALAQQRAPYLLSSWHASTRPPTLDFDDGVKWLGLKIVRAPAPIGDRAVVEFVARYRIGGRAHRLHETSRFVREGGHWYYVDGDIAEPADD